MVEVLEQGCDYSTYVLHKVLSTNAMYRVSFKTFCFYVPDKIKATRQQVLLSNRIVLVVLKCDGDYSKICIWQQRGEQQEGFDEP